MKKIYTLIMITVFGYHANAQLVAWDFNGNIGSEVTVSPTITDANLTVSQISRGVIIATAITNSYAATSWTTTNTLANAMTNNSYYQFTVKPKPGFTASFSEINANFKRSPTGPTTLQWMYSLDGTNFTNIGSPINFVGIQNNGATQAPVDLNSISQLQNLASNVTVTFRLYGYNATNTAGAFAFGRLPGNDIDISGKVVPSIVVPIKLISFSAVNNNNLTKLHWLVNCTSNYIKFEMQRAGVSGDYTTFYSSTESQARCAQPFDINDNNTPSGISLYRLKMIDIDGRIAYSNTIQVVNNKTAAAEIKVIPSLVSSNADIVIPSEKNYKATILIIDNQGRQVTKIDAQLLKGTNHISLNTSDYTTGKYYVKVAGDAEQSNTAVFIKQ